MLVAYAHGRKLSTPMGVDYVVIGFDVEVQPLVTHNAAWPLRVSAIYIDVVSNSFAIRTCAMSAVGIDVVSVHKLVANRVMRAVRTDEQSYEILQNRIWYHKIAVCIARYK